MKLDIYESLCMCIYLCEVYLSDSVKFCGANPRVSGNRGMVFTFSYIQSRTRISKKKKINKLIDLFTICITCAMVKIFYQDSAKQ